MKRPNMKINLHQVISSFDETFLTLLFSEADNSYNLLGRGLVRVHLDEKINARFQYQPFPDVYRIRHKSSGVEGACYDIVLRHLKQYDPMEHIYFEVLDDEGVKYFCMAERKENRAVVLFYNFAGYRGDDEDEDAQAWSEQLIINEVKELISDPRLRVPEFLN